MTHSTRPNPSADRPLANVPSFDLDRAKAAVRDDLRARLDSVLERNAFVGGPEVAAFEEEFAAFVEAPACVGVANGTDALVVAMRALGIAPGDEVIVPAFTFIATGSAVALAGGTPVFADIRPDTFDLDPDDVEARVTDRTVGVVGVHLFGLSFDADALNAVCRRHDLWLVEDAAQAHGARYTGADGDRAVGTLGDLATWSFYPSKNLGAFGDAGAITGADPDLVGDARRIANHGRAESYRHVTLGTNSRLDGFQAAVLRCRLPHLAAGNERRRAIAARYDERLGGVDGLTLPVVPDGRVPVFHQYTVRTPRRNALQDHLTEAGIGSSVFYPLALHRQPAFAELDGVDEARPEAERACDEVLSLPMFPELTDDEVERVADAVEGFFC